MIYCRWWWEKKINSLLYINFIIIIVLFSFLFWFWSWWSIWCEEKKSLLTDINTLFNAENSVQRNDGRDYKLKQLANDGICSKRYITPLRLCFASGPSLNATLVFARLEGGISYYHSDRVVARRSFWWLSAWFHKLISSSTQPGYSSRHTLIKLDSYACVTSPPSCSCWTNQIWQVVYWLSNEQIYKVCNIYLIRPRIIG